MKYLVRCVLAACIAALIASRGYATPITTPILITGGGPCYVTDTAGSPVANILLANPAAAGSAGFSLSGGDAGAFAINGLQVVIIAPAPGTYSATVSSTGDAFVLSCICATAACAGG